MPERKENFVMKSISDIKKECEAIDPRDEGAVQCFIQEYVSDERSGVASLVKKLRDRRSKLEAELDRLEAMRSYEKSCGEGVLVCGIDEVGRGPLAGPVMAGAVILPPDLPILWLNDSKKLSEKKREELCAQIKENALAWAVGEASCERIDEINILQATYEAMRSAIASLSLRPQVLLNDAVTIPGVDIRQVPIIKGDAKSVSIAAASIVAKVTRDHLMEEYDSVYPGYGFASNKGYGSREHIEAIKKLGPCPIHRRSFISAQTVVISR